MYRCVHEGVFCLGLEGGHTEQVHISHRAVVFSVVPWPAATTSPWDLSQCIFLNYTSDVVHQKFWIWSLEISLNRVSRWFWHTLKFENLIYLEGRLLNYRMCTSITLLGNSKLFFNVVVPTNKTPVVHDSSHFLWTWRYTPRHSFEELVGPAAGRAASE